MNAIEQAIIDMCENNTMVTSAELITLLSGSPVDSTPRMDAQAAENTIVDIDRAIMEFSDGYMYDEYETEEENYARVDKIIATLEATREYFECVIEYTKCFS
jgi:predicted transcriptional regulator